MNKKCLWGVAPQDDFANEVIATELAKTCEAEAAIARDNIGNEVKLYIVEHSFITELSKVSTFKLRFKIYAKEGNAAWREKDLSKLKKPSKKVEKVMKDLGDKK